MKTKRISDKNLLASFKNLYCIYCFAEGSRQRTPTEADHITTKGAGGDDVETNLIPSCREHHMERHRIGIASMIERHKVLQTWLNALGRYDVLERAERMLGVSLAYKKKEEQ